MTAANVHCTLCGAPYLDEDWDHPGNPNWCPACVQKESAEMDAEARAAGFADSVDQFEHWREEQEAKARAAGFDSWAAWHDAGEPEPSRN